MLAVIMIISAFSLISVGATGASLPSVSYYSGKADKSWYDSKNVKKEYHITSADQLAGLAEIVNGGQKFENSTFYLDCDIVWNDGKFGMDENGQPTYNGKLVSNENKPIAYTPIGTYPANNTSNDPGPSSGKYFFGNFDGQGHVISGLYVNEPTKIAVGLFSVFVGEYMKDLSIVNSYFGSFARSGSFAGFVYTIKEKGNNSTVGTHISGLYSDATVVAFNSSDGQNGRIGGIVGLMVTANYGSAKAKTNGCIEIIENCWFAGAIQHTNGTRYSGGILGVAAAGNTSNKVEVYMNNCLMTGAIYMGRDNIEALRVGGILGNIWQGTVTLTNCVSLISDTNVIENNYFEETKAGKSAFVGCQESQPAHIIYKNCFYRPIGMFDGYEPNVHNGGSQTTSKGKPGVVANGSDLETILSQATDAFDFSNGDIALKLRTGIEGVTDRPEPPVTEPATEPVTDPATDPATDPVTEPVTAPVTEPADDPTETEITTDDRTFPTDTVTTEPQKSSCGGVSLFASLLALIALTGAAIVINKK